MVDLTDATDDDDNDKEIISVPKVEDIDIPMEEVVEEKETAQAQTVKYPRGMRIRTKPVLYEPVMTGKIYQRRVNNLCYRGTWYTLNEVIPFGDTPYKMGVINLNIDTAVQVHTPDEG